jgi:SAM-dependent methyltransferase
MKPGDIVRLYDREYASEYDTKFLLSPLTKADAAYELELLGELLNGARSWLDVACGTGYFLARFPHVRRAGLDLSPAMLDVARAANPGAELLEANYLEPRPAWNGAFDMVSCMWYAYCLADTLADVARLISNLADWTSDRGTCFVPLADPAGITGYPIPYHLDSGGFDGEVSCQGIVWSYSEYGGAKVHRNLLAPHPDYMLERFLEHFEDVRLIRYPPAFENWIGRPAVIARAKRDP